MHSTFTFLFNFGARLRLVHGVANWNIQAMDDAEELKQSAKDDDAAFYKPIKDLFIRLGYMPINETRVDIAPMKSFIKINHIPTAQPLSTMKKMELAAAVKAFIATPPAAGFLPAPVAELAIVDAAAAVAAPAQ